jgi:hypothetical protein
MPTVMILLGCRVVIYPNDHRPRHVHVIGDSNECVFNLNSETGAVQLRENYGFSQREVTRISEELAPQLGYLCQKWDEIHDRQ